MRCRCDAQANGSNSLSETPAAVRALGGMDRIGAAAAGAAAAGPICAAAIGAGDVECRNARRSNGSSTSGSLPSPARAAAGAGGADASFCSFPSFSSPAALFPGISTGPSTSSQPAHIVMLQPVYVIPSATSSTGFMPVHPTGQPFFPSLPHGSAASAMITPIPMGVSARGPLSVSIAPMQGQLPMTHQQALQQQFFRDQSHTAFHPLAPTAHVSPPNWSGPISPVDSDLNGPFGTAAVTATTTAVEFQGSVSPTSPAGTLVRDSPCLRASMEDLYWAHRGCDLPSHRRFHPYSTSTNACL